MSERTINEKDLSHYIKIHSDFDTTEADRLAKSIMGEMNKVEPKKIEPLEYVNPLSLRYNFDATIECIMDKINEVIAKINKE